MRGVQLAPRRAGAAACVAAAAFAVLGGFAVHAAPAAPAGPCSLLERADIARVLHWTVGAGDESPYRLPQSSGSRCTYDAHEGTVLIVAPDAGSSFFQNNDLVDPFRNGLGTRVTGVADSAQMFDNTIYLNKHGASVSVAVLTTNGTTSGATLVALARIVARRMP